MEIIYRTDFIPDIDEIIEVYKSSGINRPIADKDQITQMYTRSNLVITAWDGQSLLGVSRSLTDFCYCCYLSDLAVSSGYQRKGIGRRLVELTKERIGDNTTLILLAAPDAINYYPKIGLAKIENGFIIKRAK